MKYTSDDLKQGMWVKYSVFPFEHKYSGEVVVTYPDNMIKVMTFKNGVRQIEYFDASCVIEILNSEIEVGDIVKVSTHDENVFVVGYVKSIKENTVGNYLGYEIGGNPYEYYSICYLTTYRRDMLFLLSKRI